MPILNILRPCVCVLIKKKRFKKNAVDVYVCVYVNHVCRSSWRPEETIRCLALEWQAAVSHHVGVRDSAEDLPVQYRKWP